ncbi:MAG TPA: SCP2 sterol-binding domain-containing protein [Alphaproteobacteria bacterium]
MPLDRSELKDMMEKKLKGAPPLGYPVLFDLKEDGQIFIDGMVHPAAILDAPNQEPVTTFTLSAENLEKVLKGDLDPQMGALLGKISISGKLGVALKLSGFLED